MSRNQYYYTPDKNNNQYLSRIEDYIKPETATEFLKKYDLTEKEFIELLKKYEPERLI